MATGTDAGEVVSLSGVVLVQVLGLISLISLAGLVRACVRGWQGQRTRILRWAVLAIPIWLFWALLRIGEYAS